MIKQFNSSSFTRSMLAIAIFGCCVGAGPTAGHGIAQESVDIATIDGQEFQAELVSIDELGTINAHGLEVPLNLDGVATITTRRASNAQPSSFIVHLVGGSKLFCHTVVLANDRYELKSDSFELNLGAESIRAIAVASEAASDTLKRLMREPDTTRDRVIAKVGEREQTVPGLLKGITDDTLQLEFRGQVRPIGLNKVVAIVLADLQQQLPDGTKIRTELVDGSIVAATFGELKSGVLTLGLAGGANATVQWNHVSNMNVQSGRVTYLSDLQPDEVRQQAYGTTQFQWQKDLNVFGKPLTLLDFDSGRYKEYKRGLGTHSYCRLQYSISGEGFSHFSAMVGLDQQSAQRGDCEVSVVGDGIELWSGRVQGNEAPHQVNVEIAGVDRLTLVVEPGEHLDLADHVNWVNARLLKSD